MENDQLKSYWSQEMAKLLDISTSTLRKWSIALETAGYSFIRDENGKRAYLERDIMPLQKMRELLADNMGMGNAARAVVLRFAEQISNWRTVTIHQQDERPSNRHLELVTQLQEVRQEYQELHNYLEQIDQQIQTHHEGMMQKQLEIYEMLKVVQEKRWWQFWR